VSLINDSPYNMTVSGIDVVFNPNLTGASSPKVEIQVQDGAEQTGSPLFRFNLLRNFLPSTVTIHNTHITAGPETYLLSSSGPNLWNVGLMDACRMGNDYVFQMLATANVETLNRYAPKQIITACPHCFNSLGVEYGQLGGRYNVVHHSQFLARLVEEGRLRVDAQRTGSVTLHDSCYLTRYNGVIGETRAVLGAVPGLELVEMDKNGRSTFCCGAGGGRMWMEEKRGTRINAERTRQALATGADAVATACPFCLVMMRDGVADAGARGEGVAVQDIAEILAAGLPAPGANGRYLPVVQ